MKLPFLQFYPADYMRDTRALSCAAKGGWVDVICMLHGSSTRGKLTLPALGWARVMGTNLDEATSIIEELRCMMIAEVSTDSNGNVTLSSRRMLRESITREQTRLRVARHRSNATSNAPSNAVVTGKKSETRNQKPETEKREGAAAPDGALADGASNSTPVLVFPCVGNPDHWTLDSIFLAELSRLYPGIDPLAHARLALAKIERGAVSKKTARGMSKFLFSWMDRSSNSARPNQQPQEQSAFAGAF